MKYGRAIKIVRAAYGLSQSALAERLSIGPSQLSLIEANKRQPSVRVLHEVSAALDVPPHLLTLLASTPEDLDENSDPKHVTEVARALLRLLVTVGEQRTLPMKKDQTRPRLAEGKKKRPA
jgi:transcriptional regulator with XRE-family HTH domain